MQRSQRNLRSCGALFLVTVLLASCVGGFPPALERDIRAENDRLQAAERQIKHDQNQVHDDLAQAPDLFGNAPAERWTSPFRKAFKRLDRARDDSQELSRLAHRNRPEVQARARRLLAEEGGLRERAVQESDAVVETADKWVAFRRDVPASLKRMEREYNAVRAVDLGPVATTIDRAEHDWPAKKAALDERLETVREIPKTAEAQWQSTESARQDASEGKATGAEIATLIQEDETLSHELKTIEAAPTELTALAGQLYDSWDKILTDLDASEGGPDAFYRERIKTIRTHYTDVAAKTTETHSDEHWVNVSASDLHSVEGDIGMAIAHKDFGLFDSEAENTPEPAGFAYVASPAQGSNQYGYWTHSGGESVWTFLPQYLILRELLWNHDYRPIATDEYMAYRTAQRSGTTYYGREPATGLPKYGSHGTFTQTHYAGSRYVQSGGFKGSAYASRGAPSGFGSAHPDTHAPASEDGAGHRFGRAPGATPSGHRFGRPSAGRRFGGRR